MIYDDGTEFVVTEDGSSYALDASGVVVSAVDGGTGEYVAYQGSTQDTAEAQKLSQFYPSNKKPWWENLAMLGVSRAVDAHFGARAPDRSKDPATFAGQNGKTYATGKSAPVQSDNTILLIILAGAALFAFS